VILGFIPNYYVTYEPHPEPLTTKMKFDLACKGLTHPTFFAFEATWAGAQQAAGTPNYRLGAKGYGERFGANLASGVSEGLFANAILPSLLHQDPRYFYRGSGTKGSRAWHAILAPFVCTGDNGKLQPNYSQWSGSLMSASLSDAYYPSSNRGAGLRVVGLPSIVSTIDFDLEGDSFGDFGPATGRTQMCQDKTSRSEIAIACRIVCRTRELYLSVTYREVSWSADES
jgi:hypothetical protein